MTPAQADIQARQLAHQTNANIEKQLRGSLEKLQQRKQALLDKLPSILATICANRDAFAEDGPEIEATPDGLTKSDLAKLSDWADNVNEAAWMRAQEVGR